MGKSAIVTVGQEEIALFNYKGQYYALANKCPHKGAPLGEGRIEEGVVICPNHEWRFELETGNNLQNPNLKTGCYPVRVRGESLYIGFRKEEKKLLGKDASALPSTIKWKIPTLQKPRNPEEEL